MHKLIILIFSSIYLNSAILSINTARDNNQTYSIVHIQDEKPITCKVKMDDAFRDALICRFETEGLKPRETVENAYFKIDFSKNQLRLTPKQNYYFYPFKKSFMTENRIGTDRSFAYPHWIIVGFEGDSRLYAKAAGEGLDFPIDFAKRDLPMVGELDFDLKPIEKNSFVRALLKIKKYYHDKKYTKVLQECDYLLETDKMLFKSDVRLYKIRAMDKLLDGASSDTTNEAIDPTDIIDLAEDWIAKNPSDVRLPEMYMYIAKTYLKTGRERKAQKYLGILKDVYAKSKYHWLSQLELAKRVYKQKSKEEGISLFKKVLYGTDDFYTASLAALKLTQGYLDKKEPLKAKGFFEKVFHANKPFIQQQAKETYGLAKIFAENNESNLSIQIGEFLLPQADKHDLNPETLQKDIAYWYEKLGKSEDAIRVYKQYLATYKFGRYKDFVEEHLDRVSVGKDEQNETKKLTYLDSIMIKHKGDAIYAKALLEKARILLDNGEYEKILEAKESLLKVGAEGVLQTAAKKQLTVYLEDEKCAKALALEDDYNISSAKSEASFAFVCYEQEGQYQKALGIAKEKSKSETLVDKLKWTYKSAQIYKKQARYKALLLASDDVEKLMNLAKNSDYQDIVYDKVQAYYHLGGYDMLMLKEVQRCEKLFPDSVKNLDAFEKVLAYAKAHKETSLIINYAKKMIDLQERHKLETYTPKLQLDYILALKEKQKYQQSLDEVLKLLYKKLNDAQRAHVLYLAGDLSETLKKSKEAKAFYAKCAELVDDSAWVRLCSENLQLLE